MELKSNDLGFNKLFNNNINNAITYIQEHGVGW